MYCCGEACWFFMSINQLYLLLFDKHYKHMFMLLIKNWLFDEIII
jgi:hypothetical protein